MNAQGAEGQDKGSSNLLWGIFFVFGVCLLIWYNYKGQILYYYLMLKKWELYFLDKVSYIPFVNIDDDVINMIEFIEADPFTQDIPRILYIGQKTGFYLSFIYAPIVLISLYFIWQRSAIMRFTKAHSMSSLLNQERYNWPQVMPVHGLDLVGEDNNKGPWAMAMTPLQFLKHHELLTIETVGDRKSPWKVQGVKKANLVKEKAYPIFLAQLGPYWEGEHELPDHQKAIFAIFLARIEHDTSSARELIEDLAVSYSQGKIDYAGVDAVLRKHKNSKAAKKCVQNHAFVMTVFAAMLELARTDGVLATADFIWLKPTDRQLWYVLNCVGRQTPYPEVAGVFAHFKAEKEMGRPLFKPVIEQSVTALEMALDKILYVDEDE